MKRLSPQRKAVKFLMEKGWQFDDETNACNNFKNAFRNGAYRDCLGEGIEYLLKHKWFFNNLYNVRILDEARKIYLNETSKNERMSNV